MGWKEWFSQPGYKWFTRPKYKIVEIPVPRQTPALDGPEMREALRALQNHPGMRYMMDRLRLQQSVLNSRLKSKFEKLDDVGFVQSGVFWTGWLERELKMLTEEPPKPELLPLEQEIDAFRNLDALLERVGVED